MTKPSLAEIKLWLAAVQAVPVQWSCIVWPGRGESRVELWNAMGRPMILQNWSDATYKVFVEVPDDVPLLEFLNRYAGVCE